MSVRATRANVEKLARDRWGADVEVFGHLSTIGQASAPNKRDGEKVFGAFVRYKSNREILLSIHKPSAGEAWAYLLSIVSVPALAAAAHWDRLADEEASRADYERTMGFARKGVLNPHDHKAVLFRDTAKSLRLEHETGIPHCACHVVPSEKCPKNPRNLSRRS